MHTITTKASLLLMIILAPQYLRADERSKKKPEYPACLKIESQRFDEQGKLHIRVNLEIDPDVRIYANPVGGQGMDHASAKLTVLDVGGRAVDTKVQYPKGERLSSDFLEDYYLYKKTVVIGIVLNNVKKHQFPLTIHGYVVGYNERGSYCLGSGKLEVKLDLDKKTEQTDAPKPSISVPDLR